MALLQALLFVIIKNVELKSTSLELGYAPVPSCPKSQWEWEDSSLRLNCNDTHKYHCTPNLTNYSINQLHKLCYRSFRVSKDQNCSGVQGDCFTEDRNCNCLKESEQNTTATSQNDRSRPNCTRTCGQNTCDQYPEVYVILLVIFICLFILSLVINILLVLWILKCCTKKSRRGFETDDSTEEYIPLVRLPTDQKTDACKSDSFHSSANMATDDIDKLTLVDYTIEDAELFILLKRQCLHQAYCEFKYLVNSRVKGKKEYIFTQRDENGCILLHYAAQGGSTAILDNILENASKDILQYTCIRKQNALHFAIREKRTEMIMHLIKIYSKSFIKYDETEKLEQSKTTDNHLTDGVDETEKIEQSQTADNHFTDGVDETEKIEQSQTADNHFTDDVDETEKKEQSQTTDNHFIVGVFAVHWVAWQGNTWLLREFNAANFDVSIKTRNGLNILDVACLAKLSNQSNKFCTHVLKNELKYNIDPMKTDISGWNIGHYASMSGRVELLKFIEKNEKLRSLITAPTMSLKTCLHIACEFANFDVVEFLVTKFASLLHCEDHLNWDALHFAAKGGSLKILKYLLENGLEIDCLTIDTKTILHVACIYKNLDISRYAVEHLSPERLNTPTNTSGLLASHYLAVEKKEEGNEAKILEVLCDSAMDLTATCCDGFTLLEWAIDHLNIDLIRAIVSVNFREKCGVSTESLMKAISRKKDETIKTILQTALNEMNEKSKSQ